MIVTFHIFNEICFRRLCDLRVTQSRLLNHKLFRNDRRIAGEKTHRSHDNFLARTAMPFSRSFFAEQRGLVMVSIFCEEGSPSPYTNTQILLSEAVGGDWYAALFLVSYE